MNTKLLSLCLLLLMLSSVACAQLDTGQWVVIYPSRGLNVSDAQTNLEPSEAIQMEHFLKQGFGIRQMDGVKNDNNATLGSYPIRRIYRYYNEIGDIEQTIAVCGPSIYFKDDSSATYKVLGSLDDSVTAVQGDSLVHGIGTNWNSLKGESDGSDWQIYLETIDATWHGIEKIHSDILIELDDTVNVTAQDTGRADISIPAGDGYVDFATFRNKLFITDGTSELRAWNGSSLDRGFFIVDSFYADSIDYAQADPRVFLYWLNDTLGLNGPSWSLDTLGNPDYGLYEDSSYCVIFPDSNSTRGYSRPHPIADLLINKQANLWCRIALTNVDTSIQVAHLNTSGGWVYISKPMFPAYWASPQDIPLYYLSLDTAISGIVDHAAIDRDSTNDATHIWIYDADNIPGQYDYYDGAYGLRLTYPVPDSLDGVDDSLRTVLYNGVMFVPENRSDSIYYKLTFYRDADAIDDDDTIFENDVQYQIIKYNYAPVGAQFVETHRNRLWCAKFTDEDDKVMYSAFNDATSFFEEAGNIPNYFYIDKGADTYISQMNSKWGQLFFYTDKSIWTLYGVDNYDFELKLVFDGVGCQSPYSLASFGGDYFFYRDGIYYFDGAIPQYMCGPVRDIFTDSMNAVYSRKVTTGVIGDQLWIGYPDGSDTNISKGLIYDFDGFWSTVDTPFVGGGYTIKQFEDDADTVLIGGWNGWVLRYNGSDIIDRPVTDTFVNAVYQSPWMSFESPYRWKQITRFGIEYSKSDTARIILQLFADGDMTDTLWCDSILATDTDTRGRSIFEIPPVVNGYNFSYLIKGERARSLDITKIFMKMRAIREDN